MRRPKRTAPKPCSYPGCTVKDARYGRGDSPDRTCARHLWGASIPDMKRAAARAGATVEDHRGPRYARYEVEAPEGHVWNCTGDIHVIVLGWRIGDEGRAADEREKAEAIADAIERIDMGTTPCGDPDCDYCHPQP